MKSGRAGSLNENYREVEMMPDISMLGSFIHDERGSSACVRYALHNDYYSNRLTPTFETWARPWLRAIYSLGWNKN